jgi:23S rRNA (cytidine1920-2'-O)/16S rRNA (cytidine1409-2'-O)-methyltransferase
MAGEVSADGAPVAKAGEQIDVDATIEVAEGPRYVSRGGIKLAGALDEFALDVRGARAVDVGASTGGFTDCLLQRDAASVTAIDVGYGQLAWELRNDERVTVLERTNIRSVDPSDVDAPFDIAVVDVSFISLGTVLGHVLDLLADDGQLVALVKPQFEAGKGRVGKKGVVRDPAVHEDVLATTVERIRDAGLVVRGLTFSPVRGPEGNIEFWVWASTEGEPTTQTPGSIVAVAHEVLGG